MKVVDLFEQQMTNQLAINLVARYCIAFDQTPEVMGQLTTAVDTLLAHYPTEVRYVGPMYRAIGHPSDFFARTRDMRLIMSQLQAYGEDNPVHQYQSWAKDIKGMMLAIANNQEAALTLDTPMVVYGQTGIALDVGRVMDTDQRYADEYEDLYDEHELLAKFNDTVHVVGFMNSGKVYSVDNFKEFLQSLQ